MSDQSRENGEKLAYFQDVTGVEDDFLCTQVLEAHGWDLDAAVSSMVAGPETSVAVGNTNGRQAGSVPSPIHISEARSGSSRWRRSSASAASADEMDMPSGFASSRGEEDDPEGYGARHQNLDSSNNYDRHSHSAQERGLPRGLPYYDRYPEYDDGGHRDHFVQPGPGIVWRIVTLPFSVVRGSYNLMYGAVGLGMWIAAGMISYSVGALGSLAAGDRTQSSRALLSVSTGAAEASMFVRNFEREYGDRHPQFQSMSFMEALRRAGEQYRFLFVYLHSPDHANTPGFCESTLCSEDVVQYVNDNFVVWGGDVRTSEGFQMSNTLKASTFPFCAVATASSNQRIALLQQIEGFKTADELLAILRRVVDEQGAALVAARVEAEERQLNRRLREEQDAAYQAALLADQERERRQREEAERAAKEAQEVERKRLDEEQSVARAQREAAERALAIERRRQEKAASLGTEPAKGANVTQVLVRLPNGERRDRRFDSQEPLQKVYDYVDTLGSLDAVSYHLVSNFPRTVYGPDKLGLSLQAAGLHPQASLFVQVDDN